MFSFVQWVGDFNWNLSRQPVSISRLNTGCISIHGLQLMQGSFVGHLHHCPCSRLSQFVGAYSCGCQNPKTYRLHQHILCSQKYPRICSAVSKLNRNPKTAESFFLKFMTDFLFIYSFYCRVWKFILDFVFKFKFSNLAVEIFAGLRC